MKSPDYQWSCQVCNTSNPPGINACGKCHFPSVASGLEIENAKAAFEGNKPLAGIVKAYSEPALILGFILIGIGSLLLRFFISSSATIIGLVLMLIGALFVDLSGYVRPKKK